MRGDHNTCLYDDDLGIVSDDPDGEVDVECALRILSRALVQAGVRRANAVYRQIVACHVDIDCLRNHTTTI